MTADPKSIDGRRETERFAAMGFDRFRDLALDPALSEHERMGWPDALHAGFEDAIWNDIQAKLPGLAREGARILDVGAGCGESARRLIRQAEALEQRLVMVDHKAMLDHLPASSAVVRVEGRFPEDMGQAADEAAAGFDVILIYSVLQIVIVDANPFAFVDAALSLLRPGGQMLVGDIPNVSKLRRFLASEAGVAHHKAYMRTDEAPDVPAFALPTGRIDDGIVTGLMLRGRAAGFDAYLVPQPPTLPMANRREDLLFLRP